MKKLFSTIVISALLCVNTFATPVVVNSEPATFEKPVIIRQSTSFLSLREIASNRKIYNGMLKTKQLYLHQIILLCKFLLEQIT